MADHDRRIVLGASLATLLAGAVVTVVAALLRGWPGALGAVAGTALAVAFFAVTVVVVSWAGRVSSDLILPAALGTYVLKLGGIGVLLVALHGTSAFDRSAFAIAVVVGACVYLAAEVRIAATARIPSIDEQKPR